MQKEEQKTEQLSLEETLRNMELHEEMHIMTNRTTKLKIIRVVGGWLYNGQFVGDQEKQIAQLDLVKTMVLTASKARDLWLKNEDEPNQD